jgi:hypothetical protein
MIDALFVSRGGNRGAAPIDCVHLPINRDGDVDPHVGAVHQFATLMTT